MKLLITALTILSLFCMIGLTVLTSEAATNFNGSTVVGIDQTKRLITIQTREGQTWTLPVANSGMLNNEQLAKGDQVTIELGFDDTVTKIIKLAGQQPTTAPMPSREDDLRP